MKVENAVKWAINIANNNKHGYDQINRWGLDFDCSSLVIQAFENAGIKVKSAGATYTGNMLSTFKKCGFIDVKENVHLFNGNKMQRGDVLLHSKNHCALFIGNGQLVHASINEKGAIVGGKVGDQTGKEICIRSYYNYPWQHVLRYNKKDKKSVSQPKQPTNNYVIGKVYTVKVNNLNVRMGAGTQYTRKNKFGLTPDGQKK